MASSSGQVDPGPILARALDYPRFLRDIADDIEDSLDANNWFGVLLALGITSDTTEVNLEGVWELCKQSKLAPPPMEGGDEEQAEDDDHERLDPEYVG